MMEVDKVNNIIKNYGQFVEVTIYGQQTDISKTRAFIQPLRYRNKADFLGEHTELGATNSEQYLYIGPADIDIKEYPVKTIVSTDKSNYLVKKTVDYYFGDRLLYKRALLQLCEG